MNYDLFRDINNLSGSGALDDVMKFSAKYVIFLAVVIVALLCLDQLRRRRIVPVVATVSGLVLTFLLGLLAAALYSERRPFQTHRVHELVAHAPGQSFPSDHATAAFGLALAALAFLSWRWGAVLFVLALLIGFARVYVGIHYPGDIGGGFLAALVGVGIIALLYHRRGRSGPVPRR
ncbi:MAG: phosphatase PAP2 family protein [Mycobacteriales bacterium]